MAEDDILTISEVAEFFKVPIRRCMRSPRRGSYPVSKSGGNGDSGGKLLMLGSTSGHLALVCSLAKT